MIERRSSGFSFVAGATIVSGIAGYLTTWLVYRQIGPSNYAIFAVFWSAFYLVVGGLAGIQQEVSRSTSAETTGARSTRQRGLTFTLVAAAVVLILLAGSSPLWANRAFGDTSVALLIPLVVGVTAYVVVAVISGALYGVRAWMLIALMIGLDGVTRLALVFGLGLLTTRAETIAWGVALPFVIVPLALMPWLLRALRNHTTFDVGIRDLSWNSTRTVLASLATASIVSGYPLLLAFTSTSVEPGYFGELIFTLTLTRAPLIIAVTALQSFLIIYFRNAGDAVLGKLIRLLSLVSGATVVLAFVAWFFGQPVFSFLGGQPSAITADVFTILVVSSGLIALLTLTGAALLTRSRHGIYVTGWLVAAVATAAMLLSPIDFVTRVELSLTVAPALGILVQLVVFGIEVRSSRRR